MHPHIRLEEPGQCPVCFMDLIPIETGTDEPEQPATLKLSASARERARIQTTEVRRELAETEIRMVGKIAYDESRVASITARAPGRLDRLYADYTGVPGAAQEELVQARKAAATLLSSDNEVMRRSAEATLAAARDKLMLLGLREDQIEALEASGKVSDHLTIYAPIGGIVVEKSAREGMYVDVGTPIYTIADLGQLWVLFEAYESDLPWLRYGQHVEFGVAAFPSQDFEATISFIDPVVDPQTRTVRVRAIVDNAGGRLKPDMFVRGSVRSRMGADGLVTDVALSGKLICPMHPQIVKEQAGDCDICGMPLVGAEEYGYARASKSTSDAPLLIPASAPLITGRRAVVYVERQAGDEYVFEGREVALGPRAGEFFVVRSGLTEGERVVTQGAFKLDSEMQIRAQPSMMSDPTSTTDHSGHEHDEASDGEASEEHPAGTELAAPEIFATYARVTAALSDDDLAGAVGAAMELSAAVAAVRAAYETEDEILLNIGKLAIATATATTLDEAREPLSELSSAVITLLKQAGGGSETYYLTFCPMAQDNRGAYWLQTSSTVSNPYYGSAMLRCGKIRDTFPAAGE